jgi:hypothetical protein
LLILSHPSHQFASGFVEQRQCVRVKGQLVKTVVFADSPVHARLILQYQFGMDSIVAYPTAITEVATIKPLTPDQQRIKSMQAQVKRAQEAVRAERARQKIRAGQAALAKS